MASAQTQSWSGKDARDVLFAQIDWVKKEMIKYDKLIWDHKSELLGNAGTASQGDVTAWLNVRLISLMSFGCEVEPANASNLQGEWTSCMMKLSVPTSKAVGFIKVS